MLRYFILPLFLISSSLLLAYPPATIRLPLEINAEIILANHYFTQGKALQDAARYQEATEYFQKALKIYVKTFGEDHPDVATGYNSIGNVYSDQGDYSRAVVYYQKALAIQLKALGEDHPDVARSYNNIGTIYGEQGEYSRAEEYFQKSLAIRLKAFGEDHPRVANVYTNIGSVYNRQGDYSRATVYYQKALKIYVKALGEDHPLVASGYNNIGIVYRRQGDYSRAEEYLQKSLAIRLKALGEDHPLVASSYTNIGNIYWEQGDYSRSADYYQKSLAIRLKALREDHPLVADSYTNIGTIYREQGDDSRATVYYQKALKIYVKTLGEGHPSVATVYHNMGIVYREQGDYSRAAGYYQKALQALVKDFDDDDIYVNPVLKGINSKTGLLRTLNQKTLTLSALYNTQSNHLKPPSHALQTSLLAADLIDTLRNELTFSQAGDLSEIRRAVYEQAVGTAFELYRVTGERKYLHTAFQTAERSKAFLLLRALRESEAKFLGGVPDALTEKERNLKINISFYEKKAFEAETAKDSAKTLMYQSYLFDKKRAFDSLRRRLEKNYPNYYQLKYDTRVASVEDVQKQLLHSGAALLEYIDTDSVVYVFKITSKDIELQQVRKDSLYASQLSALRKSLSDYRYTLGSPEKARQTYIESAYGLYQTLFPFSKDTSTALPEELIIIPSGGLGHIPFEALLYDSVSDKNRSYRSFPYLLKRHRIRYGYSSTQLLNNKQKERRRYTTTAAAYCPSYETETGTSRSRGKLRKLRDGNVSLPGALREVKALSNYFEGDYYFGKDATEKRFKEDSKAYGILHLAMHGQANEEQPLYSKLLFERSADSTEDDTLHTYEIYNLKLQAELVVLSACETGYGKKDKGEGVLSLARGFLYAGVRSVVQTLWQADDEASSRLTELFYKYLSEGKARDEALRQAKLTYLEEKGNKAGAPIFWAGYVLTGENGPLEGGKTSTSLIMIVLLSGTAVSAAVFMMIRNRRRQKTRF